MSGALMQDELTELRNWLLSLETTSQGLFVALDAAQESRIPAELKNRGVEFASLYRGEPEEVLNEVAPYLVKVDRNLEFMNWLLDSGWGKSWGMFLLSSDNLEDLRRHLRHFLLVRDPGGRELYFRFYDPRVLQVYLPTCTAFEAKRFFGPVTTYLMEADSGQAICSFSRNGAQIIPLIELHMAAAAEAESVSDSAAKPDNRRLKIREEQMKVFSEYMDSSFVKRAALHLRQENPEATATMTSAELDDFIQNGANRAAEHEFTREIEIGLFLELMLLFGVDFDDRLGWAQEILDNPDLTREDKMDVLREHRDAEVLKRTGEHQ
jgi:hypothetical protein